MPSARIETEFLLVRSVDDDKNSVALEDTAHL